MPYFKLVRKQLVKFILARQLPLLNQKIFVGPQHLIGELPGSFIEPGQYSQGLIRQSRLQGSKSYCAYGHESRNAGVDLVKTIQQIRHKLFLA
jgi:hypothetical protein